MALHILDKSIQNLLEDSLFSFTSSRHTAPRVHMLSLTNLFPITYETHEIANRGTTLFVLGQVVLRFYLPPYPGSTMFFYHYAQIPKRCALSPSLPLQSSLSAAHGCCPIHFFYYLLSIPDLTVITFIPIIFPSFHEEHLALNPIPHDPYSN